jgi:hypothetical protein
MGWPMTSNLFPIALLLTTSALACGGEVSGDIEGAPKVLGLSRTAVTVGEQIDIIGGGFVTGLNGHTEVRLDGEYHTKNGPTYQVDMQFRPHWEDGNTLVWSQFGPFTVPFTPEGNEIGTFHGQIVAINVRGDGSRVESEPVDIALEVLPSIVIREFQPLGADCDAPSKVILGGIPYRVTAEAVGFKPVNFSYVMFGEPGQGQPRIIRHAASSNVTSFGGNGEILFANSFGNKPFYVATFAVTSLDDTGREHAIALSYGVHNVIEYIRLNTVKIAEIEPAVPVSGCNAGGQTNGRTVTYTEQTTDTRTRTVGTTWNESFMEQAQSTNGGSTSTTNGVSVQISQSQTEGWEMNWSHTFSKEAGAMGEAGFNVPFLASAKVGVSGKIGTQDTNGGSVYGSSTRGYTVGRDYSVTDTESWAFSTTRGHEVSQGGSDFWAVSSSQSSITSFQGLILPGEYGVFYRQATRLALPGAVVAYNLCGVPNVVAETNFYDYTWSVDLAQGADCPPFPESDLPPSECFVAPCSGPQ